MSLLRIVAAALPAGLSDRKTLTRTMIGAQHAKLTNFSSRISENRLRNSHRSQPGPSSVHGYGPQFADIGTTISGLEVVISGCFGDECRIAGWQLLYDSHCYGSDGFIAGSGDFGSEVTLRYAG